MNSFLLSNSRMVIPGKASHDAEFSVCDLVEAHYAAAANYTSP